MLPGGAVRRDRTPAGLSPLTRCELRQIARENARALFPSVVVQRLLATIEALERELLRGSQP